MKEKILRGITVLLSLVLLLASFGIIFWINKNETVRLALYEQFAIEKSIQEQGVLEMTNASKQDSGMSDTDQAFADIDTLVSSISSDDLPEEE